MLRTPDDYTNPNLIQNRVYAANNATFSQASTTYRPNPAATSLSYYPSTSSMANYSMPITPYPYYNQTASNPNYYGYNRVMYTPYPNAVPNSNESHIQQQNMYLQQQNYINAAYWQQQQMLQQQTWVMPTKQTK